MILCKGKESPNARQGEWKSLVHGGKGAPSRSRLSQPREWNVPSHARTPTEP